jgi:hypothetical protein
VGAYGEFDVWGFASKGQSVFRSHPLVIPHDRELTKDEREAGHRFAPEIWQRLKELTSLGLVEWVPILWDSESADGEPIHPLAPLSPIDEEARLAHLADYAGRAMVTDGQLQWAEHQGCEILCPVRRHFKNVALLGVARLTFRPHTRATASWWREVQTNGVEYAREYEALLQRVSPALKSAAV